MSRLINKEIKVSLGPGLQPVTFEYAGGRHRVAGILETWVMFSTPWWEDPGAIQQGPAEVTMWRVRTTQGGVYELEQAGTRWRLYKAYD